MWWTFKIVEFEVFLDDMFQDKIREYFIWKPECLTSCKMKPKSKYWFSTLWYYIISQLRLLTISEWNIRLSCVAVSITSFPTEALCHWIKLVLTRWAVLLRFYSIYTDLILLGRHLENLILGAFFIAGQ